MVFGVSLTFGHNSHSHDLYKWQHDHRPRPTRSASFSHVPLDRSVVLDPTLAHIKEPGGFRRNFVVNRAQEQGLEAPTVLRNVVDFLFLYGHFVGTPPSQPGLLLMGWDRLERIWGKMSRRAKRMMQVSPPSEQPRRGTARMRG